MKHVLLFVALFFAAHSALGQTNTDPAAADTNTQQQVEYQPVYQQPHDAPPIPPPPPTPPPAATQGRTDRASGSERWRYDPAARRGDGEQRPSNESGIERALKGINPCNVPYGGLLAEWRIAVVQETIENVYFWALLVLCCSFVFSTAYNAWLLQSGRIGNRLLVRSLHSSGMPTSFRAARRLKRSRHTTNWSNEIDAEDDAGEEQSTQASSNFRLWYSGVHARRMRQELPHGRPQTLAMTRRLPGPNRYLKCHKRVPIPSLSRSHHFRRARRF